MACHRSVTASLDSRFDRPARQTAASKFSTTFLDRVASGPPLVFPGLPECGRCMYLLLTVASETVICVMSRSRKRLNRNHIFDESSSRFSSRSGRKHKAGVKRSGTPDEKGEADLARAGDSLLISLNCRGGTFSKPVAPLHGLAKPSPPTPSSASRTDWWLMIR